LNAGKRLDVAQALDQARNAGVDRLDAQLLLALRLGHSRSWLLAHDDALLDPGVWLEFESDCARRAGGVPLAYLTGEREFHGLPLKVTPAVLVPRPETETLVDWALDLLRRELPARPAPAVVDLGTGCGAIALAVTRAYPNAIVTATDCSAAALAVARENAATLALPVQFRQGDWWSAVDGCRFDLALCNPPYVRADDPHLGALLHEPLQALTAGPSGLEALRTVVAGAGAHLNRGGWLVLEHGCGQAEAVSGLLRAVSFQNVITRNDIEGRPRCTGGQLDPASP
jgi:release factor glutamine methyltransferase